MSKYKRKPGLHHPELYIRLDGNQHIATEQDRKNMMALFDLVDKNRNSFFTLLNKEEYAELANWAKSKVHALMNQRRFVPTWGTICIWLFDGMVDFPKCPVCGKTFQDQKNVSIRHGYNIHCSDRCKTLDPVVQEKIIATSQEQWGCRWPSQSPEARQTYIDTCQERYGVNNVMCLESTHEKGRKTSKDRYGDENYRNSEQRIKTCMKLYGQGSNGKAISETLLGQSKEQKSEHLANIRKSKSDRYGDENYNNPEKRIETCLEKYGVEYASQSGEAKAHAKQTFMRNYGYDHDWKVPEIQEKIRKNRKFYEYDGFSFDSKAEICFYIGCKDGGIKVEREPEPLKYMFEGKEHLCFYDFRLDGDVKVEIKGDHFFRDKDRNKDMVCPWKPRSGSGLTQEDLDAWTETKHQCMVRAGVIFITSNEYSKYIRYVEQKYSKDFLKQFWHKRK